MPYVPTWKERLEEARPYVLPAVAVLILVILTGWLVWREVWPRVTTQRDAPSRLAARQQAADDVDLLEKSYRQAVESKAAESVVAAQLDRTIERQRERMRLEPKASREQSARLGRLETERAALVARMATARSAMLEIQAEEARQAGKLADAVQRLREAWKLRREANANAESPEQRDVPREARLAQAIDAAEAEPLHVAVEVSLTRAVAAAAREQWDDALKAYAEARAAQVQLNQRYPATRYASVIALDRIDADMASLKAAGAAATVAARERDGDAAVKAGRPQEAAALYAAAAGLQVEVNEKFPRSRFVATQHVGELRAKRDTILSRALVTQAADLDREITAALVRRQTVAASGKISAALALMTKVAAEFPDGLALDRGLRDRLTYLGRRRADLAQLQGKVYAGLGPVPGAANLRMMKTEVPQELFVRVMNTNPSRHTGPALPVDSVSWEETQEFCRRLSWLLGCRVRLPLTAEFRAATGGGGAGRANVPAASGWFANTSDGQSHEVGRLPPSPTGFHDLAGNLAEWLQPETGAGDTAPVAGGSYLDSPDALRAVPFAAAEKRERARHIGFRVVVELPAE